jgi:hypothetical protein
MKPRVAIFILGLCLIEPGVKPLPHLLNKGVGLLQVNNDANALKQRSSHCQDTYPLKVAAACELLKL